MPAPVKVPKNLKEFISGSSAADMQRAQDLVNAFSNLRVQITQGGSTRTVVASVQITGESAILQINL